jgi:hypothetical protein
MKTLLPIYLRLGPRPRLSCARHFVASGLVRKHWSSAGPAPHPDPPWQI